MSFVSLFAQSSYYSQDITAADSTAYAEAIWGIMLFTFIVAAVVYVIMAFLLGRIFKKAGVESWKAWVPIYNNWILLELGGQKGYWAVLALIPLVNIVSAVFMIIAMYYIGLRFGKDSVFVLIAIFLPLVWYAWLAFDNSTWKASQQSTQPVDTKTDSNTSVDPSN